MLSSADNHTNGRVLATQVPGPWFDHSISKRERGGSYLVTESWVDQGLGQSEKSTASPHPTPQLPPLWPCEGGWALNANLGREIPHATYLRHHRQPQQVADATHDGDEDFPTITLP